MRCYKKVPEILLPQLNHLPLLLFASISFKVVSFCIDTVIPVGCPWSEALLEVMMHQLFITSCDSVLILSVPSKHHPLIFTSVFGVVKKSRDKVQWLGRLGVTVVVIEAKNCHTTINTQDCDDAGPRSCCATCLDVCTWCFPSLASERRRTIFLSPSVLLEQISYAQCLQCQTKQINIDLTSLLTCCAFFGHGEVGVFHWDDCCLLRLRVVPKHWRFIMSDNVGDEDGAVFSLFLELNADSNVVFLLIIAQLTEFAGKFRTTARQCCKCRELFVSCLPG